MRGFARNSKINSIRTLTVGLVSLIPLTPLHAQDLPNFHQVSPGIYRGAAPTPAGLLKLKAMGVRTVIDLRIAPKTVQIEKKEVERLGMHWINLPMGSEPPTSRQVEVFLTTLKQAPQSPVFVHCQHGADRTGCMIGIWRVTQEKWTYPQAYTEMHKYGFKPYLHSMADSVRFRAASPAHQTQITPQSKRQ